MAQTPALLGMTFAGLTAEMRQKYTIADSVASGVVIASVAPNSLASDKRLQAGDVLVEVDQEPVRQASDVVDRLNALAKTGKTTALLLIANGQGEVRFVAVPTQAQPH
jgi:serine protease Do